MTTPDKEEMPTKHRNAGPCLREALALVAGGFEGEGLEIENEWRRSIARNALNGLPLSEYQVSVARRYLSTLPVNDRQTSDDVGILRQALAAARTEADDMRKRWREAKNALHQFNYPPDPKMLREVADEIDCGQTCEFGNIEWDTGAHNCSKREREGCPGDNAIQLREFADAIEARAALKGVPQPATSTASDEAGR